MTQDRLMIAPYTIMGKLAKFPFKFYYNTSLYFKSFLFAHLVCLPFFYKIQLLSYSDANLIKYEEYLRKERRELEEHQKHLL